VINLKKKGFSLFEYLIVLGITAFVYSYISVGIGETKKNNSVFELKDLSINIISEIKKTETLNLSGIEFNIASKVYDNKKYVMFLNGEDVITKKEINKNINISSKRSNDTCKSNIIVYISTSNIKDIEIVYDSCVDVVGKLKAKTGN